MNNIILIPVLGILILLSAYFSASETAFSTANRAKIKNLITAGNKKAKTALYLMDNYDKLLTTILVGNNIVNIASASIATVIFTTYFGDAGVTISTAIMTVLVLIFGEISPKTLAKESPEAFALFSAPVMRGLSIVLTPINFLFTQWKKLMSKIFKTKKSQGITEEELITIVEEATQDGGIDKEESELIRSAIEFNELEASDVLTPRVSLITIDETATSEDIMNTFTESGFSRLPVCRDTIDDIIGVLHIKDFYANLGKPIKTLLQPVAFTTGDVKISDLLKNMQHKKTQIAIVTDEYGGTLGIVTLEDIIEEIVGEIWDEHDVVAKEIEKIAEDRYKIDCLCELDNLIETFGITDEYDSTTVGGWVCEILTRIPVVGDTFSYKNLDVRVIKATVKRPLEIIVKVNPIKEEKTEE